MMKTTKTILLLITLSLTAFFRIQAQTPGFDWAVQIGGDSLIMATSITVDASGNQIITGYFNGTADFNPDPDVTENLTANGQSDIFILKLDADGELVWAASMGDTKNDRGSDVVTDANGNIYITGYFYGTIDADPGPAYYPLTQARYTALIIKIEPDGDLIWATQMGIGDWGHVYGYSIALDNSLNVITSGTFYGRVDFDPGAGTFNLTSTNISSGDAYVHKLDAAGNFIWAKQISGQEYKNCYSLATDVSGDIYTSGWFAGTVDFNPDKKLKYNLTSFGDYDTFIQKLSGNGVFIWAKQIGGTAQDISYSLTRDPSGNIYVAGFFYGTADFNPGSGVYNMTPFGGDDAYILKLDLSGNLLWAKQLGGPSWDSAHEIKTDSDGNVYVSGFFYATADFDPSPGTYYLTSNGHDDSFIYKSDPDGNFLWITQTGGQDYDYGLALALDANGNIFTAGGFGETVDFDPNGNGNFELTNSGDLDMFVQKLNTSGGDNCPIPNGLIATGITETSTTLGWNAVTGAGGYYVRYRILEASDWVVMTDLVTGTTVLISDLTAGTYYEFQVMTDCLSNYSYSCEFTTLGGGCPDSYEPNETLATAFTIPVNTDITAKIINSNDTDWFKFNNTTTNKKIKITLTNLPANYDVALYKSDGTQVGISQNPGTNDETIIYNTTKVGTYYIRVYGADGAFDAINCYTLKAAISSTNYKSAESEGAISEETAAMNVYPNPATNLLNIDFTSPVKTWACLRLISSSGQVVLQKEFDSFKGLNHYWLNLSNLYNGLYFMELTTNTERIFQEVMINK